MLELSLFEEFVVAHILECKRIENIAGKRENEDLDYYFLHFLQYSIGNFSVGPFLSNNKILTLTKLKAYADDDTIVTKKLKFVLGKVENIVGKGENAGHQHFQLFLQYFQKASCKGSLKVGIV